MLIVMYIAEIPAHSDIVQIIFIMFLMLLEP